MLLVLLAAYGMIAAIMISDYSMRNSIAATARARLDARLLVLQPVERFRPPAMGWIRAIRDALGMSGAQLARRLGISPQSANALEKSEAGGTIQLDTLRRAAEALDCTLVYALVPNTSLETAVTQRARSVATRDLQRVAHTMKLEDQETGAAGMEERVESYVRDVLRDREIWET